MIKAAIPANETQRVAAVRALQLLDTPSEIRFDRITHLTTRVLDMPMAYVALIDSDRQWLKSTCGLKLKESKRAESFCGHAILNDKPMIVEDTLLDERFHDNPLVVGEPYIRFYAGHPLADRNGFRVGTLCVADRKPRQWTEQQREDHAMLAEMVETAINLIDTIELQRQLLAAKEKLARDLEDAARYVRSMLPEPLDAPVATRWIFEPCSDLGGDILGYHWLDEHRLSIYLIDACGHGVGSALLSISAVDSVRSGALGGVDFADPSQVLSGLNAAFPMDKHHNKYFTMWYGVYDTRTRRLDYATAGHPPALLFNGTKTPTPLGVHNFFIGLDEKASFDSASMTCPPGSRLFVFSDGTYEIRTPDGGVKNIQWLAQVIGEKPDNGENVLERTLREARRLGGNDKLDDDFSLLEVTFP